MVALLIWLGWVGFSTGIYFVLPYLPLSKHLTLGSSKILRIQTSLFVAGWAGKFFAGGLYFTAGQWHAVAMACCALAALFAVLVLGCIFRKFPSKTEQIDELKRKLAELGVSQSDLADQTKNNHNSSSGEASAP